MKAILLNDAAGGMGHHLGIFSCTLLMYMFVSLVQKLY